MISWTTRTVLLLALLALPLRMYGQLFGTEDVPAGSWSATTTVTSQYFFRGARLGGPALQPSLEYNRGSGGVGLWTSLPLADKVEGQSDPEIDLYGFYAWPVNEKLTVVPGFTLYGFPNADRKAGFYRTIFEPNFAVNFTAGPLRITPKAFYDTTRRGFTTEISAAFALPLTAIGSELDFVATAGTFLLRRSVAQRSPAVKNWSDYLQLSVATPFQLSHVSKVTIGFTFNSGGNAYFKAGNLGKVKNPAAVDRAAVTVGYTRTF